ncbi:MAG TPA: LysM peptidoglycan-binding domain-containing protein, partial [Chitinophagaceae bacterium]|nr:LysM peptidoglycan-binding domain-containing protein [Chitinophagaceae bacterium]
IQRKRKSGEKDVHTVLDGETLHHIAQSEGIRLESLLAYNFLKPDMQPRTGEQLYLKSHAPSMPRLMTASAIISVISRSTGLAKGDYSSEPGYLLHRVQAKETMYSISKKYEVNVEDLMQWNDLRDAQLKTGQQLRIKKM